MNKLNYLGKKTGSGIPHFIISKMPQHDVYIEPFLGTGAIMSMKAAAKHNIGIDRNKSILDKLNFNSRYSIVNDNSLEVLVSTIEKYISAGHKNICIYLDPPYVHSTRSCLSSCKYLYDMADVQHVQLLEQLLYLDGKYKNVYLLLSGYKSELYMSMLHGWSYFETNTMSRGGKRIESLWTNFNPSEFIKHDYNFIGKNYTDRQRIKRKAQRWVKNLEAMPLDEKIFILQEISHSHNVYLLLSGYKSELYMSMLHGWSYFETNTMSRGGKRIESLWTNFNPSEFIKHDYNFIGKNYTDRQRIKRKAQRWVKNLEAMPLDEKIFILQEISHSHKELYCSIDKTTTFYTLGI